MTHEEGLGWSFVQVNVYSQGALYSLRPLHWTSWESRHACWVGEYSLG